MQNQRRPPEEYIDALTARGGRAYDVIQTDDEWIILTREKLAELILTVQRDASEARR